MPPTLHARALSFDHPVDLPQGERPEFVSLFEPPVTDDASMLGQFIPLHYHHAMLLQQERMDGFAAAIAHAVRPGMKVLELGAGTGVLSFFAARAGAAKVYSVERLPEVADAARRFVDANGVGDRVTIIEGDAATYLPPEPVDVVICEMLHSAMLREKQLAVIEGFKARYAARFGGPLPRFIPEATVMAMQPLMTNYEFHGFDAPVPMFVDSTNAHRSTNLAGPSLYALFSYDAAFATRFVIDQTIQIEQSGTLNGLRFITKNLLAIVSEESRSIDWNMQDLIIPLANPVPVEAGDVIRISFEYDAGASLANLAEAIERDAAA